MATRIEWLPLVLRREGNQCATNLPAEYGETMILFSFAHEPETRKHASGEPYPCLAFRWTVQASRWRLGIIAQHQTDDEVWRDTHSRIFGVSVTKHWAFGSEHIYYDGPHCSFSLGPIHIVWGGGIRSAWCDKGYDDR